MALTIETEMRDGVAVVRLHGELTGPDGHGLVDTLRRLLDEAGVRMVLDLSEVTFVNSEGLGGLVRITAQANSQGGRVVIADPTPFMTGVFQTTKLDRFFELSTDVQTALAMLTA